MSNEADRHRLIETRTGGIDMRNIESDTVENTSYRRVVYTFTNQFQLALMSLLPSETIPREIHPHTVQFVRVEQGTAECVVETDGNVQRVYLSDGDTITIPPGIYHEFRNANDKESLKLYVIYTPPEHNPNTREWQQP